MFKAPAIAYSSCIHSLAPQPRYPALLAFERRSLTSTVKRALVLAEGHSDRQLGSEAGTAKAHAVSPTLSGKHASELSTWEHVTELVLVGSGSYEQSWRAIPTQRPGPRDMYPVLSGNLQDAQPVHQADGQAVAHLPQDQYGQGACDSSSPKV